MPGWPLILRLVLMAMPLALTIAAFSNGAMALAVSGVIACAVAFQRMFLSGL